MARHECIITTRTDDVRYEFNSLRELTDILRDHVNPFHGGWVGIWRIEITPDYKWADVRPPSPPKPRGSVIPLRPVP
jgi:hypothetical protein